MPDELDQAIDLVKQEDPSYWGSFFDPSDWRVQLLLGLLLLAVLIWFWRRVDRALRRRRPPVFHPKLQAYAGGGAPDEKLTAQRRAEAARILATSSTPQITGYEIVEQIEAVFVDGFRHPEEALEGLKASAAMKGANAVANVRQERHASGKCSASGDAVVINKLGLPEAPAPKNEPPTRDPDSDADSEQTDTVP